MSTSEDPEYSEGPDLQSSENSVSGNHDTPSAVPRGDDNAGPERMPERHVSQGGEANNPELAEVLAETDTLEEVTYPDVSGTFQETEWVGQGGELDNTVQESRVGLDRLEGQHDAPGEEGNDTGAGSAESLR
jgi:hypothetical protein